MGCVESSGLVVPDLQSSFDFVSSVFTELWFCETKVWSFNCGVSTKAGSFCSEIEATGSSETPGGSCPPRCMRMWCWSTRALVNLRWHNGQEFWILAFAGRAWCVAKCDLKLPLVEKDRPHNLHGNGRSPRCVAWCKRSARGQLITLKHTPH